MFAFFRDHYQNMLPLGKISQRNLVLKPILNIFSGTSQMSQNRSSENGEGLSSYHKELL